MNIKKLMIVLSVVVFNLPASFAKDSDAQSTHRPSRFSPSLDLTYNKDVKAIHQCTLDISINNIDKLGRPFYYEIRKLMLKKGFTVKENYGFDNVSPDGHISQDQVAESGEFWLYIDVQGTVIKSAEIDVTRIIYPDTFHAVIPPDHANVFQSEMLTGYWSKTSLKKKILSSLENVGRCHH